jgi:hypothetical protein
MLLYPGPRKFNKAHPEIAQQIIMYARFRFSIQIYMVDFLLTSYIASSALAAAQNVRPPGNEYNEADTA